MSDLPSWETMGENPSQSSTMSSEEGASSAPTYTATAARKRKGSPKMPAREPVKRPKHPPTHAAIRPAPTTRPASSRFGTSKKGKGKARETSLDNSDWSPSRVTSFTQEIEKQKRQELSSQSVSKSQPTGRPKLKATARKSAGTLRPSWAKKTNTERNLWSSSESASTSRSLRATSNIADSVIEISDDDIPVSSHRPAPRLSQQIPQQVVEISSGDDDDAVIQSRQRSPLISSKKTVGRVISQLPPPGWRYTDNDALEMVSSEDEDGTVPPNMIGMTTNASESSTLPAPPISSSLGSTVNGLKSFKQTTEQSADVPEASGSIRAAGHDLDLEQQGMEHDNLQPEFENGVFEQMTMVPILTEPSETESEPDDLNIVPDRSLPQQSTRASSPVANRTYIDETVPATPSPSPTPPLSAPHGDSNPSMLSTPRAKMLSNTPKSVDSPVSLAMNTSQPSTASSQRVRIHSPHAARTMALSGFPDSSASNQFPTVLKNTASAAQPLQRMSPPSAQPAAASLTSISSHTDLGSSPIFGTKVSTTSTQVDRPSLVESGVFKSVSPSLTSPTSQSPQHLKPKPASFPARAALPPAPRPPLFQIRTEPSVPPMPTSKNLDISPPRQPRTYNYPRPPLSSRSAIQAEAESSSNASTPSSSSSSPISQGHTLTAKDSKQHIRTSAASQHGPSPVQAALSITGEASQPIMAKAKTDTSASLSSNTAARSFVSRADGKSLSEAINQAYRHPVEVIDLTLIDDSDEDMALDDDETFFEAIKDSAKLLASYLKPSDNLRDTPATVSLEKDLVPPLAPLELPSAPAVPSLKLPESAITDRKPASGKLPALDRVRETVRAALAKKKAANSERKLSASTPHLLSTPDFPDLQQSMETANTIPVIGHSCSQQSEHSISTLKTDPPAVDALIGDVDALSMSKGDDDIEMGDETTSDPALDRHAEPPFASRSSPICSSLTLSASDVPEEEICEDRTSRYRKPPALAPPSPEAEEEEVMDLLYPETKHTIDSSPLKNETLHHSASPPPLPPRTSSRLSSRSTATSSSNPVHPRDVDSSIEPEQMIPASNDSPYITWETYRRAAREHLPKYFLAENLPHTLQDYMNSLPEAYRKSDEARLIFEAAIKENTADDEPDAPYIEIYNNHDDEVTPPWEFYYTNKMWHGEGVPGPDLKSLRSCDCQGRCQPRTCSCVKKQSKYTGRNDFVYNDKGRLIDPEHYPIFECNDLCGCGEECRNKVVQKGRKCVVNIVKTAEKGWGVFAGPKKIPAGTFVGIYAGELLKEAVCGEERGFKYNVFGRTYLFNIDGYHLQQEDPDWEPIYVVDAYHAGNFTRFLNHSCEPNCMIVLCYINDGDMDKPLLTVFTKYDVEPWAELSFSYSGLNDEEVDTAVAAVSGAESNADLAAVYAKCRCGAPGCKGVMFR